MPDTVKMVVVERNSAELDYPTELELNANIIPFSHAGFTADNVEDAIAEITGSSQNFAYNIVPTGDTITIPLYQQMIVYRNCRVDGALVIDGELVIFY